MTDAETTLRNFVKADQLTAPGPGATSRLAAAITAVLADNAALRDALNSARDGFINLRPGTGPMHRQMTKHIVAIDEVLNPPPSQGTPQRDCTDMAACHAANGCLGYCKTPLQVPSPPSQSVCTCGSEWPRDRHLSGCPRGESSEESTR